MGSFSRANNLLVSFTSHLFLALLLTTIIINKFLERSEAGAASLDIVGAPLGTNLKPIEHHGSMMPRVHGVP